jgi:hypothetical protein
MRHGGRQQRVLPVAQRLQARRRRRRRRHAAVFTRE